jgi:hypothetical protein
VLYCQVALQQQGYHQGRVGSPGALHQVGPQHQWVACQAVCQAACQAGHQAQGLTLEVRRQQKQQHLGAGSYSQAVGVQSAFDATVVHAVTAV